MINKIITNNKTGKVAKLVFLSLLVSALVLFSLNTVLADETVLAWEFNWGYEGADAALVGDYNGDGSADLAIYCNSNCPYAENPDWAAWYIQSLDTSLPSNGTIAWAKPWGYSEAEAVAGDFDGDGEFDLSVYAQDSNADGMWYILSVDNELIAWEEQWGITGLIPIAGDFDGDGASDLAVWCNNNFNWFIKSLNGDTIAWGLLWGYEGTQALAGDFDGDGADDLAIYDDSTGMWYIKSVDGKDIAWEFHWGYEGTQALAGDFDGDGADDLAVYKDGRWDIFSLEKNDTLVWNKQWGFAGAQVFAADFNDDGDDDLAVYDGKGKWYILDLGLGEDDDDNDDNDDDHQHRDANDPKGVGGLLVLEPSEPNVAHKIDLTSEDSKAKYSALFSKILYWGIILNLLVLIIIIIVAIAKTKK